MGLSDPRMIFGVHSISAYSRVDSTPYGIAKVIGQFSANFAGNLVEQMGGSSSYPWAVENGPIKADLAVTFKEYADWMFTLFLGQVPTDTGADATGTVSTLTNKLNTSVVSATVGCAAVIIIPTTGLTDLKFGKYVIKAVGINTVDVFCSTDADFNRGTAGTYLTDGQKIAAALLVPDTSGHVDIVGYGLRISGGSGTIGMTEGDTATFEVKPPSTKSMTVTIGSTSSVYPEFGVIAMAQKRGSGELCELDLYRCKGIGLPIDFKEKAFSDAQVKAMALYDSAKDAVYKIRFITP